jgi:hypothetical protein
LGLLQVLNNASIADDATLQKSITLPINHNPAESWNLMFVHSFTLTRARFSRETTHRALALALALRLSRET